MGIVLVAGPPCAGKSTFAREHMAPGDSILDFDDLTEELGATRYQASEPQREEAGRLWKARLSAYRDPGTLWVIWTAPRRAQRGRFRSMYHARVVVVAPPISVCLERAKAERPPDWPDAIARWFRQWEPSRSGRETVIQDA